MSTRLLNVAVGVAALMLCVAGSAQGAARPANPSIKPAWAAHERVHFVASPRTAPHTHADLGQRCDTSLCPTPPLVWNGGAVQHAPVVYLIFWGGNWNSAGASLRSQLAALFSSLPGSSWQGILTQYHDETGYVSAQPSVGGTWVDAGAAAPAGVDDAAIRAEVTNAIAANGWSQSAQAQFIVFTAPGSTYASGFVKNFCAYHGVDNGTTYSFDPYIGDQPFRNLCSSYDPAGNVDHVTSMVSAHEYAESATDPFLDGWLTSDGFEIADVCSSGDDVLPNGLYAQGLWDNHQSACSLSDPSPDPIVKPSPFVTPAGEVSAFYRGFGGTMWEWDLHNSVWTNFNPGASPGGDPATAVASHSIDSFYQGVDGTLWVLEWDGSHFTTFHPGTALAGDPATIATGSADDAYFRGTDGAVWGAIWDGGGWAATRLGGSIAGRPSAVDLPRLNAKDVFYRATDGTLWVWEWNGTSWSNFHPGAAMAGNPSAIAVGAADDAYFRGTDGAVWGAIWTGGGWTPTRLGGSIVGDPTAVSIPGTNIKDVFYRGTDGTIWLWEWNGSTWSNFHPGAAAVGDAAAVALPGGGDDVFFQGPDQWIWGEIWNGHGWTTTRLG